MPEDSATRVPPGRWSRFWSSLWHLTKVGVCYVYEFIAHGINTVDPVVDLQLVAFCILFPFSIYWLHTRPVINTQWAACFSTMWAAIGLKIVLDHRKASGGSDSAG